MDCLFCKIAKGDMPANIIYKNEAVVAFDDIHPQAPQHKIIIPRKHIATLNDLQENDSHLIANMLTSATHLAKELGMAEKGYRLVTNCNSNGGQTVFHLHIHLLGGRQMAWPPG